ncbi:MAG: Ribonucleoside-diphosphate reductase 1 subunit alpha [Candidatus Anoxychlamydiales bacterium]|nr:Ribonucleoside-diphosphate reductase 1 subunit alpha [Candidatus Anoxychlamydiales bacterium]
MSIVKDKNKQKIDLVKTVVKRDGRVCKFNIEKVKKVIAWAIDGLNINPLKLEASIDIIFKDKITTSDIQENLIYHCLSLTSVNEPDFRIASGRLFMMNRWKDTQRNRGYKYSEFAKHIETMVLKKRYDEKILKLYSKEELDKASKWLNQKRDLDYDYAAVVMITKRYLLEDELLQEAYLTIALLLASTEKKSLRLNQAKIFYEMLSKRKLSLATPILLNLRRIKPNLSSCFIIVMDDDIDSIFATVTQVAKISKNGGGVGINLSKIRAQGSYVAGNKNASGGVVPWIRILNDTAIAVNQMGKRAGAATISLDIWHLDIEGFLELQTENGDQRRKAYDIFPQVIIPDLFMNFLKSNKTWVLFDPYEVKTILKIDLSSIWGKDFEKAYQKCIEAYQDNKLKLVKEINSKELFKQIMKTQIETGMPYLFFKDTANRDNPNSHVGYIPAGNLCMESFSNVKANEEMHTCNLVSLNLANIEDHELKDVCGIAVRILDNTIDLTTNPDKQSKFHNDKYRTIGIGSMGLADYLAKNELQYEASIGIVSYLFEKIALYSIEASIDLAKERGPYEAYKNSLWDTQKRIDGYIKKSSSKEKWRILQEKLKKYGIRNSQLLAIAPNTSSALLQGCTPSVLPVFSKFYFDKNAKGALPICPPFIKERFWYYKEYKHMDLKAVNSVISEIQKWTDTGISYELIFNLNMEKINAKYIYECLIDAWEKKIKTIYYVRTIQKDGSSIDKNECVSCAN